MKKDLNNILKSQTLNQTVISHTAPEQNDLKQSALSMKSESNLLRSSLSRYSSKIICLIMTLLFWSITARAIAETGTDYQLILSPDKCVSLRQGQTCHVDIELSWSTKNAGRYCIYASNQEQPMRCWSDILQGEIKMEFASDQNTWFYLRKDAKNLAEVELKMAWVYKRKRSSLSWRVF